MLSHVALNSIHHVWPSSIFGGFQWGGLLIWHPHGPWCYAILSYGYSYMSHHYKWAKWEKFFSECMQQSFDTLLENGHLPSVQLEQLWLCELLFPTTVPHFQPSKKSSSHANIIPKLSIWIEHNIEITMYLTLFWNSLLVRFMTVWDWNKLDVELISLSPDIFFSSF